MKQTDLKILYNTKQNVKQVAIPFSTKSIGNNAFNGCESLIEVIIPPTVVTIEKGAFQNCHKILKDMILNAIERYGFEFH